MPGKKHEKRFNPDQKAINAAIRKIRRKVFVTDEGTVTSVSSKECTIWFSDGDRAFGHKFPTWRLHRVHADEVGAKVKHTMSYFGDMVISRLTRTDKDVPVSKLAPPYRWLTKADFALLDRNSEPEPR
jgi:hypothetical protein